MIIPTAYGCVAAAVLRLRGFSWSWIWYTRFFGHWQRRTEWNTDAVHVLIPGCAIHAHRQAITSAGLGRLGRC